MGLGLAGVLLLPVGLARADDHPNSALLMGLSGVDREAGIFTQVEQFVTGASKADTIMADAERDAAEDKANREIEPKQKESRRVDESQRDYSDDSGSN